MFSFQTVFDFYNFFFISSPIGNLLYLLKIIENKSKDLAIMLSLNILDWSQLRSLYENVKSNKLDS